jgi:DNA-binding transcriptional LysR family regulator
LEVRVLNLFQIECFLALSESLNFTQAANNKFITQPTLSRNIATLEQELGVQLLYRSTKAVTLTAAGAAFAKDCVRLVEVWNESVEQAKSAQEGTTGVLTLGIQRDTFEPFTVDLVREFRAKHSGIELILKPLGVTQLPEGLNTATLDLIIADGMPPLQHPGRLLLSSRQECAALPIGHPLAERSELHMEELRQERFVAMSPNASSSGYQLLIQKAIEANFTPNIVAFSDYVPGVMMLVACDVGVSVLYHDLAVQTHDRVKFVPLVGVTPFKRWLMWDRSSKNPAVQVFVSFAEERQTVEEPS